jgi:uncharacterized membrane protein YfcA
MTSTVGIWPSYAGGVAGFRKEVGAQKKRALELTGTALLGAVLGSVLLFTTPQKTFAAVVPYLVLAACAMFALQPSVTNQVRRRAEPTATGSAVLAGVSPPASTAEPEAAEPTRKRKALAQTGVLIGAIYGGYFGAGLGVVLLALLGFTLPDKLIRTNGLRAILSLVVNTAAALVFVIHGDIAWADAGLLALTSLAGGYFGARVARRLPPVVFRIVVLGLGLATAIRLIVG